MKFLVDENLPPRLSVWLRERGHEAVHVKDPGLIGRPDAEIRTAALASGHVIITQDTDFESVDAPQVLRLAIGNAPTSVLLARFETLIENAIQRLNAGEQFVVLN